MTEAAQARSVKVRGVVQGVGFRPFVFRLATANALAGWVLNEDEGVQIHVEGGEAGVAAFVRDLAAHAPPAARIASVEVRNAEPAGVPGFEIRASERRARPAAGISADLPVCPRCLDELFDPGARRCGYPYINCTDCGPRYSILLGLPYDRRRTTMAAWGMDEYCAAQYGDPADRRFHAQPVACPECGPHYFWKAERRASGRPGSDPGKRAPAARGRDLGDQGNRRLSSCVRRAQRQDRGDCCANANIGRRSRSH